MKNRLFAVTLSVVLLGASLYGCGNSNETTKQEMSKGNSKQDKESEHITENVTGSNPTGTVYDLGGLTLPLTDKDVTLTYMGSDAWVSGASYKDGLPVQNEIQARTGVKINWDVYSSDLETVLQTRLASSKGLPDIVEVPPFDSNIGISTYSKNGVLIPLNDLIDEYAPNIKAMFKKYPALKAQSTAADGNIYGLPGWLGNTNEYVPDFLYIRQDWLDKLNLDMPKTPDELYSVLKAFKEKDPNGNGKQDEIPIAVKGSLTELYFLMTGFGFTTNSLWYIDENEKVQYAPTQEEFKAMLEWLNMCYAEGLIGSDIDGTLLTQNITEDKVGIVCHDPVDNMSASDDLVKGTNPNCNYQMMDMLKKDKNDDSVFLTKRNLIWHYYGVTSACENPEVAIKWIDYVYASEDGQMLYSYGVEGLSYELDDSGEVQFTDFVKKNKEYTSPFLALRSIGAWPTYLINDNGEAFMKIFEGTKVEDTCKEYYGKMIDPFPEMLGTAEESEVYVSVWGDLKTYFDEEFTAFVIGTKSLNDFDKFVENMRSMELDDIIRIKTTQYERYLDIVKE